ncbi:MAG TPA: TolC family protein [Thermoanaerobaculia bacterium]|nr:TolC family protein [Thermoanaerobaculia bacterium]
MFAIRHALAVAFQLLAVTAASAQHLRLAPEDPVADRLVAEALLKAPEIESARAEVEAAKRRIEPARTLPDPSASFTYQNDGTAISIGAAEGSFAGLMLNQPFPWPGKLALAGRAAASEAREIEVGTLSRATLAIEARVRNAWYDLVLARSLDTLIEERRATASQVEATTRERYAAGLAVQQDVLRAQVELARIDELKVAQRAAITVRLAELNGLLGRPLDTPLATPVELPSLAPIPPAAAIVAGVLSRNPEAAGARQAIETGGLGIEIANKNFLPDFVVSGGAMYRGNFAMGPMWQVGVGVSLPIRAKKRQQNQLAEAQARVAGQTAQAGVVRRELDLRTHERIVQLESASEIATLHQEKMVPLDQLSFESALASYQAGKVPFITVFDAVNTLYGDRATLLELLAEAAKWRVAIDEGSLQPTALGSAASISSGGGAGTSAQTPASSGSSSTSTSAMTSMR